MSFSKLFCNKTPFKNKSEEAKTQENVEQKPLYSEADWHKVASVTDAAIKKGAGAYIEVPNPNKNKQEGEGSVAKMSPLEQGGYEGGGDIAGAYYVPTGHMYANMFAKIGQAVADIDANKKKKEENKKKKNIFSGFSTEEKSEEKTEEKTESMFNPDGTLKKSASERAQEEN